jgi:2-polyprenyl-3-methyl-5-hydroxy-6-metoxy-1,4-benzoquinol methylase
MQWSKLRKGRGDGSLSTRKVKVIKNNVNYTKKLIKKSDSVLDIGCSNGKFLRSISAKNKVGMDIDKSIKAKGFKLYDSLSKIKGSFNIITLFSVVEHLQMNELKNYLKWCKKHLKKNGRIVITTPNISCPLNAFHFWDDITHVRPLPYLDFKTMLLNYFNKVKVHKYARVKWFRLPFCMLGGDTYLDLLFDCSL